MWQKIITYISVNIIRIVNTLIPKNKRLVLFSSIDGFCGNAKALYLYMQKNCSEYKLVWLLHDNEEIKRLKSKGIKSYYSFSLAGVLTLFRAKYIITTHLEFSRYKAFIGQKYINLWHGMPLKKMGFLDRGEKELWNYNFTWRNCDIIPVSSEFFATILSAQTGIDYRKFKITGAPRNDFLFNCNGRKNLQILFPDIFNFKKIILYCPTFRIVEKRTIRRTDSAYNIEYFISKYFNSEIEKFYEENKFCCLIKLHPFEEKRLLDKSFGKNIKVITSEILKKVNLSLEEILNGVDLLITDYSSIYIDYLLLERPLMFIADDIEEYNHRRGIMFNDYDFFACGPKVSTESIFRKEILMLLSNAKYYKKEREERIKIFHQIRSNFCKSVLREIQKGKN